MPHSVGRPKDDGNMQEASNNGDVNIEDTIMGLSEKTPTDHCLTGWRSLGLEDELEREFRRLLKWELAFQNEGGDICVPDYVEPVEAALFSIARNLASIIKEDPELDQVIAGVKSIFETKGHTSMFSENISGCQSSADSIQNVEDSINRLFEVLSSFRALSYTRAHSMSRLPAMPSLSSTILRSRKRSNVKASIDSGKEDVDTELRANYPPARKLKRVRFSLEASGGEDLERNESPRKKLRLLERDDSSSLYSGARTKDTEGRIILCLFNSCEAFSSAPHSKPWIKRPKTDEILVEKFLSEDFPTSADLTNKILDLLMIDGVPETWKLDADPRLHMESLDHLDAVSTLIEHFPDWQIFTSPRQHVYAKSAITLVYFSLLKEATDLITKNVPSQLEKTHMKNGVRDHREFLCACMERFLRVNRRLDTAFPAFDIQIESLISKLKPPSTSILSSYETGRDGATGSGRSRLHKFCPLSIACFYLSGPEFAVSARTIPDLPDNLESILVYDLLRRNGLG
ncbi:hypothetical protein N7488_010199 [Penicillium malachiteum]|nr:hypothetical protein N7488_010199 [Penicillium malachiteum]